MRRKLVAGNWKMNGNHAVNAELLAGIMAARPFGCDVAVCVPFPYLSEAAVALAGSDAALGRARLLGACIRRLHRRGVGRHAGRVWLPPCDRRPQ